MINMGSRKEHEEMLQEVLIEFKKKGFKVIPLTKKHPDGIMVINERLIGIEVTSGKHDKPFIRKKEYENSLFDDIIIIGKTAMLEYGLKNYTSSEAYYRAIELRKSGLIYKDIQMILEKEFNLKISQPTLSTWCTKRKKPYLVKNIEQQ